MRAHTLFNNLCAIPDALFNAAMERLSRGSKLKWPKKNNNAKFLKSLVGRIYIMRFKVDGVDDWCPVVVLHGWMGGHKKKVPKALVWQDTAYELDLKAACALGDVVYVTVEIMAETEIFAEAQLAAEDQLAAERQRQRHN